MIEAILYVEFAEGAASAVDQLSMSLGNCLQLIFQLPYNGMIVHLLCNDLESLNQAINHDFSGIDGVTRITTCIVNKR